MWAFLKQRLARRRSEQSEIADRASQLIQSLGDAGYYEARERARAAGRQGETVEARRWSNVAREIGSRRRMKTGLNGWDRIGLDPPRTIELAPAADVGETKAADQQSFGPHRIH